MAEALEPAADQFVLRLARPSEPLPEAIAKLGHVEAIGPGQPLYLVRVEPHGAIRQSWRTLVHGLGGDAFAYPVLLDRDGAPHYPTGEVTVRFARTPTPAELDAFAKGHRLRLLRANDFAPQQFVLEPLDRAHDFLPDLVARLCAAPGIRSAWANTLSRYRRGGAAEAGGRSRGI